MIRVYLLPVETISGTEVVAGIDLIHDALLECAVEPDFRVLIMDTTDAEHDGLVSVADSWIEAPQETIDLYNSQVTITPPNPDIERAQELLVTSPDVITQPEIWELLRIFGRLHGIIS